MEDKIDVYFDQIKNVDGEIHQAQLILDLLLKEQNCYQVSDQDLKHMDLDQALDNFYRRKEFKYVKVLLEHFIETGNFDLPVEKFDTVHRLDRFRSIKSHLCELLSEHINMGNGTDKQELKNEE